MPIAEYKVCIFGSGGVGKSCLTMQFVQGIFLQKYDPTIEDVYKKTVEVDERQYSLEILDTAGTEDFAAMRDLYVKNGQGFILVYSITSQATLNDLKEFYDRILRIKDVEINGHPPMILVGNKSDLEDERVVGREVGQALAKKWKCSFLETSAKDRVIVNEVFFELVRQISRSTNTTSRASSRNPPPLEENTNNQTGTATDTKTKRRPHLREHVRKHHSDKCTFL